MSIYSRLKMKDAPIDSVTNAQAKILLSKRHPFEAPKSESYWGNLAFAA